MLGLGLGLILGSVLLPPPRLLRRGMAGGSDGTDRGVEAGRSVGVRTEVREDKLSPRGLGLVNVRT